MPNLKTLLYTDSALPLIRREAVKSGQILDEFWGAFRKQLISDFWARE